MPPSLAHSRRHQQLWLPGGRWLGYAEYGDPAGQPIFLFHGMPGSRLTCYPDEAVTATTGARVITVDRPGYGLSSFQPRRTLLDWPQDITALADALHLARYAVAGVSNGAPYALACAYQTPEQVTRVGIIAGRGPLDKKGALHELSAEDRNAVRMARSPLWGLMRCGVWLRLRRRSAGPERFWKQRRTHAAPSDQRVLARPAVLAMLIESTREAVRNGTMGYAWDAALIARPWGFDPVAIRIPVYLWHGEADRTIPAAAARALSGRIPVCTSTFYPGEGHLILYDHWAEILTTLI